MQQSLAEAASYLPDTSVNVPAYASTVAGKPPPLPFTTVKDAFECAQERLTRFLG